MFTSDASSSIARAMWFQRGLEERMNGLRVVILGFIMSSAAAFGDAKADPVPFASWQDPCGYQGIPIKHATAVQKMTEAEAYIVPKTIINPRPDDPNFYQMTAASTFTTWANPFGPDPFQVCPGAPFYDDPTMSVRRGRSGFLVGPNLVVTGSHTYGTFDPTAFRVVFGMTSRDPSIGLTLGATWVFKGFTVP